MSENNFNIHGISGEQMFVGDAHDIAVALN